MNTLRINLFASLVLAVGTSGGAAEKQLKVFAGGDETESGIRVREGETVRIDASGTWVMGGWIGNCGPNGFSGDKYLEYNRTSRANHGALIVRFGDGGWHRVGVYAKIVADETGELVFSPNDTERGNNRGSLTVTVEYAGTTTPPSKKGGSLERIQKEFQASAKGGTSSVRIEKGDRVEVSASGRWIMGGLIGSCGPDGMDNKFAQEYNVFSDHLHGKLAAKVVGDDGWYVVGKAGSFTAGKSGNLMWMPNDTERDNNSGALDVVVTITRRGTGDREKDRAQTVNVSASSSETTSSISVRKGQRVSISASGTWKMGGFIGSCDADGMSGYTSYNRLRNAKHGCLIVKIVGDDGWYAIGKSGSFRAEVSGRLVFAANDNEPDNNSGSLSVRVTLD